MHIVVSCREALGLQIFPRIAALDTFQEGVCMVQTLLRRVTVVATVLFFALVAPTFSLPSDLMLAGSTKLTDGTTMHFRLFVPKTYSKDIEYPVVITLHGIGECGNDNINQVNRESIVKQWMEDSVQEKYAPFILSPQCPSGLAWGTNGKAGIADVGAVKILDSLRGVYSLDSTRFYVSGLSWGGVGTWGMMNSYPEKYAAANPCAAAWVLGGTAPIDGPNILKTPFWASTGTADNIMDGGTDQVVNAVEEAGVKVVRFTSFRDMANPSGISVDSLSRAVAAGSRYLWSRVTNGQHADGWLEAYNSPFLVPWMFSKSRVDGETVFTWPAPGTQEKVNSRLLTRQPMAKLRGELIAEKGYIFLRRLAEAPVQMKVYSLTGRLVVSRTNLYEKSRVRCDGIVNGVYYAEITPMQSVAQSEVYRVTW